MQNISATPFIAGAAARPAESAGQKTVLITGASAGIGRAAAELMLRRGWKVYGAARRMEKMQELAELGLHPLPLDVTDASSCAMCVQQMLQDCGHIDGLVNCAGYGSFGAVEDVPLEEARRQFEVNVFGLAAMTKEVLPFMRRQGSGRIVNISSMGGQIYSPMGGWYYASKRAVEAISDSMRIETAPYGVKVVLIEPGVIKSEWSSIASDSMQRCSAAGPYALICEKMRKVLETGYSDGIAGTPEYIASLIERALCSANPKIRYAGPWDAKLLLFFKKYAPDAVFDLAVRLICT